MQAVQAGCIIELANGPVNQAAADYLAAQAVTIIPDIIANAGGVVVSYLEWIQNKTGEHWPEAKVNQELETYLIPAVREMTEVAKTESVPLKEAAFMVAIKLQPNWELTATRRRPKTLLDQSVQSHLRLRD